MYETFIDIPGSFEEVSRLVTNQIGSSGYVRETGFLRHGREIHRVYLNTQVDYLRLREAAPDWFDASATPVENPPGAVLITIHGNGDTSLLSGLIARTLRLQGYAVDVQGTPGALLYDQHPNEDFRLRQIILDDFSTSGESPIDIADPVA